MSRPHKTTKAFSNLCVVTLLVLMLASAMTACRKSTPEQQEPGAPALTSSPQPSPWTIRTEAIQMTRGLLANAPQQSAAKRVNPGRPFTYEEQVYDKPAREWWWRAGSVTVVVLGGAVLTYFTAGLAAPYVGAAIGSTAGLSGAAAVSYGLAVLGGGAVAAGGFGMAGGTVVIGLVTDLAISTTLEYSLNALRSEKSLKPLDEAISLVDLSHDEAWAWQKLDEAASSVSANPQDYVASCHAVASAFLRWIADENIERAMRADQQETVSEWRVSDRQRVLSTCALRLLEECRRCEPRSSLVHHALGNLYWWLSVRGGYEKPEEFPTDLSIPSSARLHDNPRDEVGCYRSALWHFAEGTASEPRNVNVPISWATALQADGAPHEAIAVVAQALTHSGTCTPTDQAKLLRTHSMLQYQAFIRSPAWDRFSSGGPYPSADELHLLLAAMQGYSQAVAIEPGDIASITSLARMYQDATSGELNPGKPILSKREVQLRLVEGVLGQEKALAAMKKSDLPASYKPGQVAAPYKELLQWSFDGVVAEPLAGDDLKRAYDAVDGWLTFAASSQIPFRPFTRNAVSSLRVACQKYNATAWLDYPLEPLDRALSQDALEQ